MSDESDELVIKRQIQDDLVEMRNAKVCDELLKTLGQGASNPGAKISQDLKIVHHLREKYGK